MSLWMAAESFSAAQNTPAFPAYISRHMRLGFDSDDVAALLSSIDSSQEPGSSRLPHLPAEILFQILDFVPIEYLLNWRLVCRGFRDAIDGPVLYDCLRRAELICYVGPSGQYPLNRLSDSEYEQIKFIRAHFEQPDDYDSEARTKAKWDHDLAVFAIDDTWRQSFAGIVHHTTDNGVLRPAWRSLLDYAALEGDEQHHGPLTWCLKLDNAVMDLDFSRESLKQYVSVDLVTHKIILEWKQCLLDFLRTETRIRQLMQEKRNATFTFSLHEDCLRKVRRERLRASLNLDRKDDRLINWEINLLWPLFGCPRYARADETFTGLESNEDDAIATLLLLRKEASMSASEAAHLKHLCEERSNMERDHQTLSTTFGEWQSLLFGIDIRQGKANALPVIPRNPAAWSDEVREREEERIRTWQSQRKVIAQIALLVGGSIDAMSLPEDAFDDSACD